MKRLRNTPKQKECKTPSEKCKETDVKIEFREMNEDEMQLKQAFIKEETIEKGYIALTEEQRWQYSFIDYEFRY